MIKLLIRKSKPTFMYNDMTARVSDCGWEVITVPKMASVAKPSFEELFGHWKMFWISKTYQVIIEQSMVS